MIKNIVFDFGNVFINLDLEGAIQNALDLFELKSFPEEMVAFNSFYEQGLISTDEFFEFYLDNFPKLSKQDISTAWNFMLKDFPQNRLDFIKKLKETNNYKLILLSNTNELHINWVKEQVPFYNDFKNCFDAFYLSHEIHLRKPNDDIFEFVLNENKIQPKNSLFIDDNQENTLTAKKLGFSIWNINPKTEDVINLFTTKNDLF